MTPPPLQGMVLGTRCHAWVLSSPPPRVCSKEGGEAVPRTYGPWPRGLGAVTPVRKPLTPAVSGISLSSNPRDLESDP